MKQRINLFASAIVFLSFCGVQAQTPYSYYYKGQKIDLEVNKTFLHIIADSVFLQSHQAVSLFEPFQLEYEHSVLTVPTVLRFTTEPSLQTYDYFHETNHLKKISKKMQFFFPIFAFCKEKNYTFASDK